ncbi:MAG TPA: PAS domain-containing protein [Spirochaetia bacterium]|nr:PAS domain-containing protein [Spirochaetales bacterium]HRY80292.1 PAS domain-containing protein [Spirochaetia bacterium]
MPDLPAIGPFSPADRRLLKRYEGVADAVATLFGRGCEIVLHSLEDLSHSVVKIVNGHVTGRGLGSPITDLGLKVLRCSFEGTEDVIGSYFAFTDSGRPIKSVTLLIRNDRGIPIGMLCINFDLSTPLASFIKEFSPFQDLPASSEHFPAGVGDLVQHALAEEAEHLARANGIPIQEKNRRIVEGLENRGLFEIKGAVESVSKGLGITKYTIYKYLREFRKSRLPADGSGAMNPGTSWSSPD